MFTPDDILKNVESTFLHRNEIILCHKDDQGISLYKDDGPEKVSDIAPWAAYIFNDYLLFQGENGSSFDYLLIDEGQQHSTRTVEGSFYLFRNMIDGERIYIPFKGTDPKGMNTPLQEFDRELHHGNTYPISGRLPHGVHNGKFYRTGTHLNCFSLKDNSVLWVMDNEDFMEELGCITSSYFFIKNDLLVVKSKFTDHQNYFTAFNPDNGKIVWQHKGIFPQLFTLIGDCVYMFYYSYFPNLQGRFCVLDIKTGQMLKDADITVELTRESFRTSDYYSMATDGSYLYIAAGYGKILYAFNMDTFKIEWKYPMKYLMNEKSDWISDLKYYNGRLFIIDEIRDLHILKKDQAV